MFFFDNDFLQIDILVTPVVLCADHKGVIFEHHGIPVGDERFACADDRNQNDLWRKGHFLNPFSTPGMPLRNDGGDKFQLMFFGVKSHHAELGVLFHKAGGNNTGGNGNHSDAQKGYDDGHQLAEGSYRIDVTVADGEQGGNRPPDTGEGVGELLRLCLVLQTVHAQRGRNHENQDQADRGDELILFVVQDIDDDIEGIILCIDPEQPEDADYPEHTEGDSAHREYDRQIIWEKGKKVDQSIQGKDKCQHGSEVGLVRIEQVGSPYTQEVFDRKHNDGEKLEGVQKAAVRCKLIKGLQQGHGKIQHDHNNNKEIKGAADEVLPVSNLNNVKNSFLRFAHDKNPLRQYI